MVAFHRLLCSCKWCWSKS